MKYALITASILSMSAGMAVAQSDAPPGQHQQAQEHAKPLHFMLSEDVISVKLINANGESAGSIRDVIVDSRTTYVPYAIIGGVSGLQDKVIAMPMERIRWDKTADAFVLDAPRSLINAMPSFDAGSWKDLDRKDWENVLKSDRDDRQDERQSQTKAKKSLIRLSDIGGTDIEATAGARDVSLRTDTIGIIDGAILELTTGRAPFVMISTGGVLGFGADDRVVPWKAMNFQGDELMLTGITAERFKQLGEVDKADIEQLDSADDVTAWYAPFDVKPDDFKLEKKPASGG